MRVVSLGTRPEIFERDKSRWLKGGTDGEREREKGGARMERKKESNQIVILLLLYLYGHQRGLKIYKKKRVKRNVDDRIVLNGGF